MALLYCFLNGEVRSELAKKNHHMNYSKLLRWWPSNSGSTRDGMTNGMLGSSRFFSASRHRASCYSSTSCTSLSLGANSSWAVNKKREVGRGLSHVGLHGSAHSFLAESPPLYSERSAVSCHPNVCCFPSLHHNNFLNSHTFYKKNYILSIDTSLHSFSFFHCLFLLLKNIHQYKT